MAGKPIEATLRLATDFAKALAELRALRKEAADAKRDIERPAVSKPAAATPAKPAAAPTAAPAPTAQADQAAQQQAVQAARSTAKAKTDAAVQGARAVADASEQAAQASMAADREALAAHVNTNRQRVAADKAAEAEALAARRAALAAQRDAERKAARERREQEDADRRAKRRTEAQAERDRLAEESAKKRAEREQTRKLGQVAPQVTDIVVGLASGQSPAMVALQQGGQLRDIFGGAGNAARALMSVITPMRVAVVGIAGTLAVWVTQIYAGYQESDRLRKSLALTGHVANTSLGQISSQAKAIAQATNVSIGEARDVMASLVGMTGQTSTTMAATGRAAAAMMKLTGASAEEATKAFADQADGITDWATKATKAYNFLTAEQVKYIRRLESQGRTEEAIRYANTQLANTLQQRTVPAVGTLEKAWTSVKHAMSSFMDRLKDLGRDESADERVKKLTERIKHLRMVMDNTGVATFGQVFDRRSFQQQLEDAQAELNTTNRDLARGTEDAAAMRAAQDEIKKQSKSFQESLTALTMAEAQKRLAAELAALDKRQAAVELADARGLTSERDKALALNKLEQQRLAAQLSFAQKQAEAARAAIDLEAKPEDRNAATARAVEAEAQLVQIQSRLQTTVADARRITEADTLAQSRDRAQQWADIWVQADQQVRQLTRDNALTAADQEADPTARGNAVAAAQVEDLREQLRGLERDLRVQISLAISPQAKTELMQQLGGLMIEGSQAVNELVRRARVETATSQVSALLERVRIEEQAIDLQVEQGAVNTEEAERRKFAAREAALPQLRQMLQIMQALAKTDAERNAVAGLVVQLDQLTDKTTELERAGKAAAVSGFVTMMGDIATGAERADRAVGRFLAGIAKSMMDVINRRLGEQLINSLFNAANSNGGWWQMLANAFVTTKHTGGMVDGAITAGKSVAPWVFAAAQVLHTGGIAGLAANEVPAILEVGEEVLTADDPRHRNNLRTAGSGGNVPVIGNLSISVSVDGGGAAGDQQMAQSLARGLTSAVQREIMEQMRPGGLLQNVRQG